MPAKISRLADYTPYLLALTADHVSEWISRAHHAGFGLKRPEWRVLAVLGDAGPLPQRTLVAATLSDKVAVNRACRALEERKLVERRPHSEDGRSHLIALTREGRVLHGEAMAIAFDAEARLFSALDDAERAEFVRMLAKLREAVRLS